MYTSTPADAMFNHGSLRTTPVHVTCLLLMTILIVHTDGAEYCQFESFNATCPSGHVIVMLDAHYGRMKTGRCVSRDYGYMGCSVSVLHIMDRICSGRRWCEYGVPRLREVIQPCPKDLISYLEASFECTQAIDLSNIRCNSSIFLDATNSTVYVSGASDLDHHAVSTSAVSSPSSPAAASVASPGAAAAAAASAVAFFHSCPLHVRVRPRQTINITLRSFGHYPEADDSPTVESGILRFCSAHMFITEGQRRHSGPLCPGRLRERNMYQSRDSTVGLYFSQQPRKLINAGQRWTFILKIEAVGCADMRTPPNAWLERLDDRAILRCNYTQEIWYLTCRDNDWVGVPGNCTEVIIATKEEKIATTEDSRIPFGLAVAVSSGIVLGFIVGFAMLLFVFFHRRRGHVDRPRAIKMLAMPCPNGISCVGGGGGGGGGSSGGETRVVDPIGVAASSPYPRRVLLQCTYNDRNNPAASLCSRLARQLPPPAGGFCPTYVGSCDIGGAFGSACNKCNVYSRRPDAAEALTTYLCTNAAGLPADVKGADLQRRQSSMVAATCDIKEGGAKAEEEENSANTFRSMTIDNTYETTRVDGGTKMAANESGTKMATEEIGTKMASRDSTGSKQPDVVQLFQTDIYSEPRVSLCSDVNSAPLAQPDTTYFVAPLQAKLSTNRVPIHDVIGKYDVNTCNDV